MYKKILLAVFLMFNVSTAVSAENFVPAQPVINISEIKSGMQGYILTVLKGTEPSRLPVKVVSIIPQKPGTNIDSAIMIKFIGKNKLSQGMSGSPLYIRGRLAGAVRSGWENSDQSLALVTPINSMQAVFNNDGIKTAVLTLSGMNSNSISRLSKSLGVNIIQGISMNAQGIQNYYFKPGDAIAAMLVWGDVELSAAGTVTATSTDGKFLAFGHEFLNRGNVLYPSARAYVHDTVDSRTFPFKLASPLYINGTITQDREAAIGGQAGIFAPSFAASFTFKNLDTDKENKYKFRVVADEFITSKIFEGIFKGLSYEAWGRKGQGTALITLRIDGKNIPNGWTRTDIFYSDDDVFEEAFKDTLEIINSYLTQPFSHTIPAGFSMTVEASQTPKILRIEDIQTVSKAKPGEEINIKVRLRGWREDPFERTFKLRIPENASGTAQILVRGGGAEPMPQIALNEGLKTIDSVERMLTEFKAADSNNELVLELDTDTLTEVLKNAAAKKNSGSYENINTIPEEEEFLSQTKERRIREGTLKIFESDYFIDGMMKKIIQVEK